MKEVREYILSKWEQTFHNPSEMRGDFVVPKPYVSPSIGGMYTDLYYWDVHFTNLGIEAMGIVMCVSNILVSIMSGIIVGVLYYKVKHNKISIDNKQISK